MVLFVDAVRISELSSAGQDTVYAVRLRIRQAVS